MYVYIFLYIYVYIYTFYNAELCRKLVFENVSEVRWCYFTFTFNAFGSA